MYSYSGWNASSYITGEMKKPEKNVPRSLLAGTLIVIVAYVLLNAVFLATTPQEEMRGQLDVALIAGKHIFGTDGGRVAGAVICLGLVSAISSMTWIGPRVSMSMGEDHWLLRLLGRKNPHGIPTNAIVLQLLIVNLLLLTRSFESVVQYTQFSLLLCSLFTVLGVMVLRATRPEIARPYRVWAYPMPPIIFAVITLWMMFYLLRWKTDRIAGGTRHCTRWSVVLLSAPESARNAHYEKTTPKKERTFPVCRGNRKRRGGVRIPKPKREQRAEIADTFWNAAVLPRFCPGHDPGKHVRRFGTAESSGRAAGDSCGSDNCRT